MLRLDAPKKSDYLRRLQVLAQAGIIEIPNRAKGITRGRFIDRAAFDELSFVFFVAWLYASIWHRRSGAMFRASWVLVPGSSKSVLALGREFEGIVLPGSSVRPRLFLDERFFACNVDDTGKPEERRDQVLCPVLNRVRLNLAGDAARESKLLPPPSKECCESLKKKFTEFVEAGLDDGLTTSFAVGGQAIRINLDAKLTRLFATGLEGTSTDLGAVLEETLLVYALIEAGLSFGLPHFTFTQPFESNEIDFAIYERNGHEDERDDWEAIIGEQALGVWELTCGHLVDPSLEMSEKSPRSMPGADHPKNKLVNFLALGALGFRVMEFHYLCVLPPPKEGLSPATKHALSNTPGFDYWCLGDTTDVEDFVVKSLDGPINVAELRRLHALLVAQVETQARAFAKRCAEAAKTPAPAPPPVAPPGTPTPGPPPAPASQATPSDSE